MKIFSKKLSFCAMSIALAIGSFSALADDEEDELQFEEAELFFELNDTDGDLGIHGKVDGDEWRRIRIEGPDENKLMDVKIVGKLRKQGLTELFFESAEPTFDELDPMDFFDRFPAGEYEIEGITLDGEEIEGEVMLSHVIPAAPAEIELTYAVDCEEPGAFPEEDDDDGDCLKSTSLPAAKFEKDEFWEDELVCVDLGNLSEGEVIISWEEVTSSHATLGVAGDVNPVYYEVVIETELEDEELEIDSSTLLPPSVTEFEFPEEYFEMADEFKFEILVRDENGNKSATEGCFEITLADDGD